MAKLQKSNQTTKGKSKKILTPLEKRTKYKGFGWHLAAMLYYQVPTSTLHKSYRNTLYCADTLSVDDKGVTHTKYCKNRWCPLCNRINMGKLIDKYSPRLSTETLYFVTLTRPNVPAMELKKELREYMNIWSLMRNHTWFKKGVNDDKVIGIRKVECTYNPQRNDYHPHFHLLVNNRKFAKQIVEDWMKMNGRKSVKVSPNAQKVKRVRDDGGFMEIFKYFTKLLAKTPDPNDKRKKRIIFDAVHMDVIFRAMAGSMVYQPFGKKENWAMDVELTEEEEEKLEDFKNTYLKFMETNNYWGYYDIETGAAGVEIKQPDYLKKIIEKSEESLKKK